MGNLPLIGKAFRELPESVTERFLRADSGCYESEVLKWLADDERPSGPKGRIGFTIGADTSPERRAVCQGVPETEWQHLEDRSDATVSSADVECTPGTWHKAAQPLRYVAVRIKKRQGVLFASGSDTMYLAVVSNRRELSAPELLRWHWQKAGTIEHVHDVTKNELGAGTPPCGRFGANALDSSDSTIAGILDRASAENPEMKQHLTSSDVSTSLGRWRSSLSPELQSAANAAFGDVLHQFGYAV
jgi:hypothetical protein